MKAEFANILSELRALAEQRGWTRVASGADELLGRPAAEAVLLTAPTAAAAEPVRDWLGRTAEVVPLDALRQDPLPAVRADRVVAVFECGTVPDSDTLDAVVRGLFCRPAGSYAVALSAAERIESEEDLELVQRMAWELLVPGPKPAWAGQDLAAHNCYLWAAREPADLVRARVERDRQALAAWLARPPSPESPAAQELARHQVLYVLDLAAAEAGRPRASPAAGLAEAHGAFQAQDALADLRRRLRQRLSAATSALDRSLQASLQGLEQELLGGLRAYLNRIQLPQSATSESGEVLREVMARYIAEGFQGWQGRAQEAIAEWEKSLDDLPWLLEGIDWSRVNEAAARAGQPAGYPQALYERVLAAERQRVPDTRDPILAEPAGPRRAPFRDPVTPASVLRAAGAVVVGPILAAFAGFGLAGMAATGIAGLLAAGAYNRHERLSHNLRICESYGQEAIRDAIRQAGTQVRERLRELETRLRTSFEAEFAALDRLLEASVSGGPEPAAQDGDRELLDAYRRRLMELALP